MSQNQINELTTNVAILHFLVHQLMVAHCEKESDPVAFAQSLLTEMEGMLAEVPKDHQWQIDISDQMKAFFAQVVSTLKSNTHHHDA